MIFRSDLNSEEKYFILSTNFQVYYFFVNFLIVFNNLSKSSFIPKTLGKPIWGSSGTFWLPFSF